MKYFIVFAVALALVNCVEYKEEDIIDSYDDEPVEDRAMCEDDDYEKPTYDIKDAPTLFYKFITDFKKQYKDENEYNTRYGFFYENLKEIIENNKGAGGSTSDINSFADYSDAELAKLTG
ncbi:BCP inhibitor [Operophtera brumata]|uniref:BCP inhibitor n=1 Tax=Operophtera brumata TaxID=104452 RepID=A0A0L7KTX2_OPEBR|nr:BCP inhibitor [Operophtera brumata]